MTFTCTNEIEISGGAESERAAAAALVLAVDSVNEATASTRVIARQEGGQELPFLLLRFESVDGLPEEELGPIASQFPSLAFTLVYYSHDGEFFGYAKIGAEGSDAASEDFDESTADTVGRRYEGDRLAFVRATYDLPRREN